MKEWMFGRVNPEFLDTIHTLLKNANAQSFFWQLLWPILLRFGFSFGVLARMLWSLTVVWIVCSQVIILFASFASLGSSNDASFGCGYLEWVQKTWHHRSISRCWGALDTKLEELVLHWHLVELTSQHASSEISGHLLSLGYLKRYYQMHDQTLPYFLPRLAPPFKPYYQPFQSLGTLQPLVLLPLLSSVFFDLQKLLPQPTQILRHLAQKLLSCSQPKTWQTQLPMLPFQETEPLLRCWIAHDASA